MYESLLEENGGLYSENEIMIFPNGIDELNIAYFMNSLRAGRITEILLYFCPVSPVLDFEKTVWLGGNEIRKSIFEQPTALDGFIRQFSCDCDRIGESFSVQVIYDSDCKFMNCEEYYLDKECAITVCAGEH